ncbi:hypothetical protein MTO96_015128 [Rhipicephalus appendiculatus]
MLVSAKHSMEDAMKRSRSSHSCSEFPHPSSPCSLSDATSPFIWSGTESEKAFALKKQSVEEYSLRVSTLRGLSAWHHVAFMGLVLFSASLLTFCVFYVVGDMTLTANAVAGKRTAGDSVKIMTVVPEDEAAAVTRELRWSVTSPDGRLRRPPEVRFSNLRRSTSAIHSGRPSNDQ